MLLEGRDILQIPAVQFECRDAIADSLRDAWGRRLDGGPELLERPRATGGVRAM